MACRPRSKGRQPYMTMAFAAAIPKRLPLSTGLPFPANEREFMFAQFRKLNRYAVLLALLVGGLIFSRPAMAQCPCIGSA